MKELDKTIKSKVEGHSIAPSKGLWDQLDQRLEANENKIIENKKTKQKETIALRWFYTSIAASIAILISIGLFLDSDYSSQNIYPLANSKTIERTKIEKLTPRINTIENKIEIKLAQIKQAERSELKLELKKQKHYKNLASSSSKFIVKADNIKSFSRKRKSINLYIEDTSELYQKEKKDKIEEIQIEYIPGKKKHLFSSLLKLKKQ